MGSYVQFGSQNYVQQVICSLTEVYATVNKRYSKPIKKPLYRSRTVLYKCQNKKLEGVFNT